jgi:hypothetical protein
MGIDSIPATVHVAEVLPAQVAFVRGVL